MAKCVVPRCSSKNTILHFNFPLFKKQKDEWCSNMNIEPSIIKKESLICRHHFEDDLLYIPKREQRGLNNKISLKENACPTILKTKKQSNNIIQLLLLKYKSCGLKECSVVLDKLSPKDLQEMCPSKLKNDKNSDDIEAQTSSRNSFEDNSSSVDQEDFSSSNGSRIVSEISSGENSETDDKNNNSSKKYKTNLKKRRNRKKRNNSNKVKNPQVHDSNGVHIATNLDLCDCLDTDCPGCFYECSKCGSPKCSFKCRNNRVWAFDKLSINGSSLEIVHPAFKSVV